MARLTIMLLGTNQVILNGTTLHLESDKIRALFFYLAMESDRPHTRQALAGLFWPDHPESAARNNLRHALNGLRHALGETDPPYLLVTRQSIRFNPDCDHYLDAQRLTQLATTPGEDEATMAGREVAVALYRGPFLAGFTLRDSPEWEAWTLRQRERLHGEALAALARLSAWHERHQSWDQALRYARQHVALAPWEETGHRAVMRLLAQRGDRAAALAAWEACREALQHELGVAPGAETTALWERIRDEQIGPTATRDKLRNLPAALIPLVGREQELARIIARLGESDCRLLTLLGPGGMGKTRLAAEAARGGSHLFEHGICFVPLSAAQSATQIAPAIAQGLDLIPYGGAGSASPQDQLLAYLRAKQLLLVLDGCEHLLESATWNIGAWISEILTAAPRIKILATSRTRLNLPWEQAFPLEGLAQEAASELFVAAARRVRPGYAVSQADTPAIAAICQRVEGMPLGLLLAASWMNILNPAKIAAELEEDSGHGIEFLSADWQGLPARERSMRGTLDRSWGLLSEREQGILAGLSTFRDGFTAEAAAITGAGLRDLVRLADRSLIIRRESGRYDLHDLLREYASVRLAESADDSQAIRDRHAAYYVNALTDWEQHFRHGREQQALEHMATEWENIRVAWYWAVERGRWDWLGRSEVTVARFGYHTQRKADTEPLWAAAEEGLRAALADPTKHGTARRGQALGALGQVVAAQAFLSASQSHEIKIAALRESLTLLEKAAQAGIDVRYHQSRALRRLGAWLLPGQEEEGIQYCAAAAELARAIGATLELSTALYVGGNLLIGAKRFDEARRWLNESLALRRQIGSTTWIMECYQALGWLASKQNHHDEATQWAKEAMIMMRDIKNKVQLQHARLQLAQMLSTQGRFQEARALQQEHVAFLEERGLKQALANVLIFLGLDEYLAGLYQEARSSLQKALHLCQQLGDDRGRHCCYFQLGSQALGDDNLAEAEHWLGCWTRNPQDINYLICLLGAPVNTLTGRWEEAQRHLVQALRYRNGPEVLPNMALYCAARGDVERAVELYALARTNPWVNQSQWHQDVFGKRIAAAAEASLSPAAIAAAQERGRARDWQATMDELVDSFPA